MKALVLAGGRGTRLWPLTHTIPKQLIPVANRPILHYVMDQIAGTGLREVGVVLAPETGALIIEALQSNPWGLEFTFVTQGEPLGLAHAVRVARQQGFWGEEPFLMMLGDNLIGEPIRCFVEAFESSRPDALSLLKAVDDPRMFGVAELDPQGRVRRLI
jgi:glucose-1-phosphate thymidylyltransferase